MQFWVVERRLSDKSTESVFNWCVLSQEGAIPALLQLCQQASLNAMKPMVLKTVANLCNVAEGRQELERVRPTNHIEVNSLCVSLKAPCQLLPSLPLIFSSTHLVGIKFVHKNCENCSLFLGNELMKAHQQFVHEYIRSITQTKCSKKLLFTHF